MEWREAWAIEMKRELTHLMVSVPSGATGQCRPVDRGREVVGEDLSKDASLGNKDIRKRTTRGDMERETIRRGPSEGPS